MIIAFFETPNFEFMAAGETVEQADEKLAEAWAKHANQYGSPAGYLEEYKEDVRYLEVSPGQAFRDKELLI